MTQNLLFQQRTWEHKSRARSECEDKAPSWFGTRWDRHSEHLGIGEKRSKTRWFEQSVCSSWGTKASQCPSSSCKCRRWLHCRAWRRSRRVPRAHALRAQSCRVQPQRCWLEARDRCRSRAWTSCQSPLRVFPSTTRRNQIQYHHQRSDTTKSLGDCRSSRLACEYALKWDRSFLCQQCSDRGRSCWRHPLCQKEATTDGTTSCIDRCERCRWC